jgi:hypothetical protein
MMAVARGLVFGALLTIAAGTGSETIARSEPSRPFVGACYCRMGETLKCTSDLTEPDCRRRCDEALCDDWFWRERLPCWNWGYGG